MSNRRAVITIAVLIVGVLALVGCGGGTTTTVSTAATETTAAPETTTTAAVTEEPLSIAFFGFAAANVFAQATFEGIEKYAAENNATATFFDGAFDASKQVAQLQDATTLGKYQVFIIQANDGAAVVPAVEAAIAQGITVVAEFTAIGTRYDTAEPQVEGMYFVGDVIVDNGKALGQLGLEAAKSAGIDKPVIAYLQGFPQLPLDNARTKAAVEVLEAGGATVLSNYVGGYTADEGRATGQDLFTAHPDVNVVIGSAQSIGGVETVIPEALKGKVLLVGNGGSNQAVAGVLEGRWYATYVYPEPLAGAKAAEIGLGAARGMTMPKSVTNAQIAEDNGLSVLGTKETLAGMTGFYND